jgi:hypothetical protein
LSLVDFEAIPEVLFVAPLRHSLQAISALVLIATLVSLGMTYRRSGSEHQEGQMPTSLTLLGVTLESNGCPQSAEALGILITPYLL